MHEQNLNSYILKPLNYTINRNDFRISPSIHSIISSDLYFACAIINIQLIIFNHDDPIIQALLDSQAT